MDKEIGVQKITLTQGCPNGCLYCYEPKKEYKTFPMCNITEKNIQILDMNFLSNPEWENHATYLHGAGCNTELVCGIDYRLLTQEKAYILWNMGFIKIRWAWDYGFELQKVHNIVWRMLKKAGYKNDKLSIFVLCDWKIPYEECLKKLDLLKVWNVKINDCWFDGVVSPNFQCNYWSLEQCKDFRRKCRKHNQLVLFKIDPEMKTKNMIDGN